MLPGAIPYCSDAGCLFLADIVEKVAAAFSLDAPSESNSPEDAQPASKVELRFRNAGALGIGVRVISSELPAFGFVGSFSTQSARSGLPGAPIHLSQAPH